MTERQATGPGPGEAPRAVVVTVGEELLLGRTVDTNAAWLGLRLSETGFRVARRATVGDDRREIRLALAAALEDAELVLLTGGLGPTEDDVTREAVAEEMDAPLRLDEAILEALRRRFREHESGELPGSNRSQAMVPEGARVLPNPHGTAPGLALEGTRGWVAVLPGVPREMEGIWKGELRALLEEAFRGRLLPVRHRTLRTTGIAESRLAEEAGRLLPEERGPVEVAFLPDLRGVDLRLTGRGEPQTVDPWLDRLEEALRPLMERYGYDRVVGEVDGDLVDVLAEALGARGLGLATAESCTGGLVAKRLTDRPGASAWFPGGVVAYADRVKVDTLAVDPELIRRHGAVSEEVVRAMAEGAARTLGARAAVALTGVAGPDGGSEAKPVGLVWYAATLDGTTRARSRRFPGDREAVRERSAQAALALLLRMLEDAPPGAS